MQSLNAVAEQIAQEIGLDRERFLTLLRENQAGNQSKNGKEVPDLVQRFVQQGIASEERLLQAFAKALHFPFSTPLTRVQVPESFIDRVPVPFARAFNVIGLEETEAAYQVAISNPFLIHPLDDLAQMLGKPIQAVLATKEEIVNLINVAYQKKVGLVEETLEELSESEILKVAKEIEQSQDLLSSANKAPVIKLVSMMLFHALKLRASDIHIQPFENKVAIRYRVDGILYDMLSVPKILQNAVSTRIKVMSNLDIAERRLPQDGRVTVTMGEKVIDIRISVVPTLHGERLVLRLLDKSARLFDLEELGLSKKHLETLQVLIQSSHGVVFVTGPTGSGKTTTLYAALKRLNSREKNIITIEDPIEYQLPGVSQIEVQVAAGLTFANGLRSILRQDPNIIMVGEVRDAETATIAIQSALTGHLVFSTLHTNDSPGAISRLLDLGVEPYLAASSVIGIMAQRLVRHICTACEEEYVPEENLLKDVGLTPSQLPPGGKLRRGKGCSNCFGTGYKDRVGIHEVLPITDEVREQVMQRQSAAEIKQRALQHGFSTLRMDGVQKVLSGMTTLEEVIRVTQMDIE